MSEPGYGNAHLNHIFQALLRLHKALLDDERVSYERVHGRIPSNGAFLQLVLGDAWFAWLRPLSQLMVKLDELMREAQKVPGIGSAPRRAIWAAFSRVSASAISLAVGMSRPLSV